MSRRCQKGLTLLELITTIAVAAILVAFAVPSYRSVVESNNLSAGLNEIVGALNYARSQAVSRGTTVCICGSQGGKSCDANGDWQAGWMVYLQQDGNCATTPGDAATLRVGSGVGSFIRMQSAASTPIYFNSNGFSMTGHAILAGQAASDDSKAICIAATGRVEVSTTPGCGS